MPIDTLKSKRRLVEKYGLDDRQAEGIVELIAQSEERGATASDVEAARRELSLQMEALEVQMEAVEERLLSQIEANTKRIAASEERLEDKVKASEERLEGEIKASEERTGQKIEKLRTEMAQQGRQTLQWMVGVAAFITVLLTLFEYVL